MVNTDHGRSSLTCCIRRDALAAARRRDGSGGAADAVLRHVTASCAGVERALDGAVLDGSWLAIGAINPGIRDRFRGGIFRIGNVAAEAHPVIAEGISMAMQSAWLLARHLTDREDELKRGKGLEGVGRAYAASWSKRFVPRIRMASLFAHLAMQPQAVTMLLPLLKRLPALLTLGAGLSGKTQLMFPVHLGASTSPR
jgi:flavin-dependent dehydrogenase